MAISGYVIYMTPHRVPVFDLDGTLLDSDAALLDPFLALGVPRDAITFGLPLDEACTKVQVSLDAYLEAYDTNVAQPFRGINALLDQLPRWALFSNKPLSCAGPEISRLGWRPEVALYSEFFGGPKRLAPVLEQLELSADQVICIGDSDHDRACAEEAGALFALAGWNKRAARTHAEIVLSDPLEVLELLK